MPGFSGNVLAEQESLLRGVMTSHEAVLALPKQTSPSLVGRRQRAGFGLPGCTGLAAKGCRNRLRAIHQLPATRNRPGGLMENAVNLQSVLIVCLGLPILAACASPNNPSPISQASVPAVANFPVQSIAPTPQAHQGDDLKTKIAAIATSCKDQYSKNITKHHADIVRCKQDGMLPLLRASHYPDTDLFELLLAHEEEIEERLDAGKITRGQADLEVAQAKEDMVKQRAVRVAVRQHNEALLARAKAQTDAISTQADIAQQQIDLQKQAQDQQRWQALTQTGLQMMQGPNYAPVTTTNCNPGWGGSVNCTQTTQ